MSKYMIFEDAYYDKISKSLYFFSYEINGLFRIDLNDNHMEFLLLVKEYEKNAERLFGTVTYINHKLVFAPLSANDILIYDIEKNDYKLIPIEEKQDYKGSIAKFYAMIVAGESVYMLPAHYPAIIQYNITTENLQYHTGWLDYVPDLTEEGKDYFRQSVCCRDGVIIAPFCYKDSVLLINELDGKMSIKSINTGRYNNCGFSSIYDDGVYIWLSSMKSHELYKLDFVTGEIKVYQLENHNEEGMFSYMGCLGQRDRVIVKPALKNDLCVVNTRTEEILTVPAISYGVNTNERGGISSTILAMIELSDDKMLICSKSGEYFEFDCSKINISSLNIDTTEAIEKWQISKGRMRKDITKENDIYNLKCFLMSLCENE